MSRCFKLSSIIIVMLLILSCSSALEFKNMSFEMAYREAKQSFEDKDYIDAKKEFKILMLNYKGVQQIDSIHFYFAQCHYKLEEYYSSSFEFNRIIKSYPNSSLVEDCYYNIAKSYLELSPEFVLDQEETFSAINKFQNYIDLYPSGKYASAAIKSIEGLRNKLAHKDFQSGYIYMKLHKPKSAVMYFKSIIDNYYDTEYYLLSLEKMIEAYDFMKKDFLKQEYLQKLENAKRN